MLVVGMSGAVDRLVHTRRCTARRIKGTERSSGSTSMLSMPIGAASIRSRLGPTAIPDSRIVACDKTEFEVSARNLKTSSRLLANVMVDATKRRKENDNTLKINVVVVFALVVLVVVIVMEFTYIVVLFSFFATISLSLSLAFVQTLTHNGQPQ